MPTISDSRYIVSATRRLNAAPHNVYDTIANYHSGHPRILPKQSCNLTVERGGNGAGTTFVVEPGSQANEAVVTITTELADRGGLSGAIEKLLTRRVLAPMYAEELCLLEAAASNPRETGASATARG